MFTKNIAMCQYQELAINKNGYVIRCQQCQHYQVFFGGIILSLTRKEFVLMQNELASFFKQQQEWSQAIPRSVLLPTPKPGVHLWLAPSEIQELFHMLDEADTEVQVQQLFALFQ